MADRLKEFRDRLGYNQQGLAEVAGVRQATWSRWEKETPEQFLALARIARHYGVSADYLLGIVDDPQPVHGDDLPPPVRTIVQLAVEWPPTRQQELLDHAHVLDRAQQRAANLSEYDSLMAMFAAAEDGPELVAMLEDLLRAVDAGDAATAQRLWARILAGRGVTAKQRPQQAPQQG